MNERPLSPAILSQFSHGAPALQKNLTNPENLDIMFHASS